MLEREREREREREQAYFASSTKNRALITLSPAIANERASVITRYRHRAVRMIELKNARECVAFAFG